MTPDALRGVVGAYVTVLGWRQSTGASSSQAGLQVGAVDARFCGGQFGSAAPDGITVDSRPWHVLYADGSTYDQNGSSGGDDLKPEYPVNSLVLASGQCVRGWISVEVPIGKRPQAVEYAPDSNKKPVLWRLPNA